MRRARTNQRRGATAVAIGLVILTLAGCGSGDGAGSSAPTTTTTAAGSSTTTSAGSGGLPPGVTNAVSLPTHILNDINLRRNVVMTTCTSARHGWKASGTANNPAATSADYTITVFFTTTSATVIGSGVTHVRLAPRGSERWTATGSFTPAPSTSCVLRGVG